GNPKIRLSGQFAGANIVTRPAVNCHFWLWSHSSALLTSCIFIKFQLSAELAQLLLINNQQPMVTLRPSTAYQPASSGDKKKIWKLP
ncbi:MAG: hypothetical protein PVF79_05875, partial [Desulfobacterales bacterium]